MQMSLAKYKEEASDAYPVYCEQCDAIVGEGLEPDATPDNSAEYECPKCEQQACCYGMESAMITELVEIT